MGEGARDVQGLPLFAKPASRQSYASMAGKTHAFQPWARAPGWEGIGVKEWSKG